ncbi:MAG: hypothetical protein F6K39_05500 [Okeania sp. SIO3B3]|nr:hypothetical protein [Okeania sp. SIO3B3]
MNNLENAIGQYIVYHDVLKKTNTEYVTFQITKPHSYCFLLEHHQNKQTTIVGCLFVYFYSNFAVC